MNVCASAAALIFHVWEETLYAKKQHIAYSRGSIATGEQDAQKFFDTSESYKKNYQKDERFYII